MTLPARNYASPHRSERGYILLTIILFVALLAIAATVLAPAIAFQLKRDREAEMIHRGTQYSRALKHYVKKFGRFPTRIEDLENTNNLRFLRRRYKDPVTGQDFKILRMGDIQMTAGAGIAGANPLNGLAPGGGPQPGLTGGFNAPGGLNSPAGMPGGGMNPGGLGGGAGTVNTGQVAVPLPGSGSGGPGSGAPGSGGPSAGLGSDDDEAPSGPTSGGNQGGSLAAAGPAMPGQQNSFGSVAGGPGGGPGGQVFGGGPMVGVASTSKEKTVRIFNKKEHYYEWQFIYDPTLDAGGLIRTPYVPGLTGGGVAGQAMPGQAGNGAHGQLPGQLPAQLPGQPPTAQPPQGSQNPGMQPPPMPPDESDQ